MPGRTGDTDGRSKARIVVGIAGGSASGKTTLACGLAEALGPDRVLLLEQDWYYRDLSHLDAAVRDRQNFDRPEAVELDLIERHLRLLRRGETVSRPEYDFATHTRAAAWLPLETREIVLLEGTLILTDAALRRQLDLRIFVDTPRGVRLERRLRRDILERGRDAQSCLEQHRRTVWPMHDLYVAKSHQFADIMVSGEEITGDTISALVARMTECESPKRRAIPV